MSLSECLTDCEMEINSMDVSNVSRISKRRQSLESCESREISYLKFISTLPRLCSPTICGTINYRTPKKWSSMSSLEYKPFEWSIDQKALLDPCDFSNAEDMDPFKEIDENIVSKQLDEENDRFFSQKQIIPSPKTPENKFDEKNEFQIIGKSTTIWSPIHSNDKTPEYSTYNWNNTSIERFKTPLNCSKSRQKKKLFEDDNYLMEAMANRSPKDSAFDTIDGQSVLSPIYSPDWRNNSLSKRLTHLSPIESRIQNYIEMDLALDQNSGNDLSMKTKTATYSELTYDMLSIGSQSEEQKDVSMSHPSNESIDIEGNVLSDYNRCQQNLFHKYLTKTSTPSHL